MGTPRQQEKILVVESDPGIRDLIARQTLRQLGYQVKTAGLAATAIQLAVQWAPDAMVANLALPDLSGKDLLVALTAQGVELPVIVYGAEGNADVMQAFRLGASDYLSWPVREAEVVSAVERALKTVRARRERLGLARQLEQTNQELQRRVRELTTIFSLGKAVTSQTDPLKLFDQVVEGSVFVTEAECGWLLVREERQKPFVLRAHRGLPKALAANLHKPFDDGLSSLVALSGEPLSIHGDPLKRFPLSKLGRSALVVPVKAQKEVIGLLVVLRASPEPFSKSAQSLLEAVADYASISLVNARLFRALENRAQILQKSVEQVKAVEKVKNEILQNASHELRTPLVAAKGYVDLLVDQQMGKVSPEQLEALRITQSKLLRMVEIIDIMTTLHEAAAPRQRVVINLVDLATRSLQRFQVAAQRAGVKLNLVDAQERAFVSGDPGQLAQVFDHLLTNAIKFSPDGGDVILEIAAQPGQGVRVSVTDHGIGISPENLPHVFERFYQADGSTTRRFGGLGIGLSLVKEIITAHGGKVRAESVPGKGSAFTFTLPEA